MRGAVEVKAPVTLLVALKAPIFRVLVGVDFR